MAELNLLVWAPLGADAELRAMAVDNAAWASADDPWLEDEPSAAARLGDVGVPTLVVTASEDVAAMGEVGDLLERGIPGAERALVEGADHVVMWREPEELARLVVGFLDRVRTAAS